MYLLFLLEDLEAIVHIPAFLLEDLEAIIHIPAFLLEDLEATVYVPALSATEASNIKSRLYSLLKEGG